VVAQRTQWRREHVHNQVQKREALYAEFISKASKLSIDALDHTLEKPERLERTSIETISRGPPPKSARRSGPEARLAGHPTNDPAKGLCAMVTRCAASGDTTPERCSIAHVEQTRPFRLGLR